MKSVKGLRKTAAAICLIGGSLAPAVLGRDVAYVLDRRGGGAYTSIALDSGGTPVIAYFDNINSDLKVTICHSSACKGKTTTVVLDSTGNVGQYASLAIDSADRPVISYYDATNGYLKVLHCGDRLCASGNSIVEADTAAPVGQHTSLALDTNGYPVVSYYDSFQRDLKVLHCGDANCANPGTNTITTPDSAGDVGRYTSLELDALGNPVISYYDATFEVGVDERRDLKVLHCGDANCSSGNVINVADAAGEVGEFTSLELDSNGNPVVSYYALIGVPGLPGQSLRVLHCANPTCAPDLNTTITSPDGGTGNVGLYTSLALDSNGLPVVSYLDNHANNDLKVLHCGNAACSSGNSISVPDSSKTVGFYTSLVLDAFGFPIVSYQDFGNDHLKALVCDDPNCI